jgi:hypothetical protein
LEAVEISAAFVVNWLVTLAIEPFQSWKALDPKSFSKLVVGIGIDLGNRHLVFSKGKILAEFFVDGGQVLTMSTPRCKEFDQNWFSGLQDDFVKVVWDQVEDSRAGAGPEDNEG